MSKTTLIDHRSSLVNIITQFLPWNPIYKRILTSISFVRFPSDCTMRTLSVTRFGRTKIRRETVKATEQRRSRLKIPRKGMSTIQKPAWEFSFHPRVPFASTLTRLSPDKDQQIFRRDAVVCSRYGMRTGHALARCALPNEASILCSSVASWEKCLIYEITRRTVRALAPIVRRGFFSNGMREPPWHEIEGNVGTVNRNGIEYKYARCV